MRLLRSSRGRAQCLISTICLLLASPIQARDITQAEWAVWPDFCKAAWLDSSGGARSAFQGRMSPEQIRSILSKTDQTVGIFGTWHFCLAMAETGRAKIGPYNRETEETLQNALNDYAYSFARTPKTAPGYSMLAAHYGTALYISRRRDEAFSMWEKGIEAQPSSRESYLAMAEMLLKERKHKDALKVLLRYEDKKTYDSPDAEYFLGHVYFELKQYDKAREHADRAYKLGYPFPGLRRKLERVGK